MGGIFSGGGGGGPVAKAVEAVVPAEPKAAEPVKATSEETKLAGNTRARRRMGTRLLFNQERSAGLGQNQIQPLGGGAGPGQNTLA